MSSQGLRVTGWLGHGWVLMGFLTLTLCVASIAGAEVDITALVDPTRPLEGPTPAAQPAPRESTEPGRYEVRSILVRQDWRVALVNEQRVSVGDVVDGARVRLIESGRVVLDLNGELFEVRLNPRDIKTPAVGSTDADVLE